MIRIFILLFVITAISISCSDKENSAENNPILPHQEIDGVTGIALSDANSAPIGLWRTPNNNADNISIYPNPNNGIIGVYAQDDDIKNLWVIPARCVEDESYTGGSINAEYDKSDIQTKSSLSLESPNVSGPFTINGSSLNDGFYRIFFEMTDGNIKWINTYKKSDLDPVNYVQTLDEACL